MNTKIFIMACIALGWFLLLYLVAFISNRHYRSADDVFWISKKQWEAIFEMWAPFLVAIVMVAKR